MMAGVASPKDSTPGGRWAMAVGRTRQATAKEQPKENGVQLGTVESGGVVCGSSVRTLKPCGRDRSSRDRPV